MLEPLVDGHGRLIGDLRVSVTDRCNFRCQYCMPAEGLPWLEREAILTLRGDRAARVGLFVATGHHRRPAHRRRAARAAGLPAARRPCSSLIDGHRGPLGHHQRLPARARRRRAGRRRAPAHQRVDRLAPARPLLRDDPPRRAAAGAARARGDRPAPAAEGEGERGRHARLHRAGGAAVRRVRPHAPVPGALHRVHAAGRRPRLDARRRAHRRRAARDHPRALPARGAAARAVGHRARLPLRRRRRRDRLHQPGVRAVLLGLQPRSG